MKLPLPIENLLKRLGFRPASNVSNDRELKPNLLSSDNATVEKQITARCYKKLLQEASSPLSQLALQVHLANKDDVSLSATDVLVHVKRLITVFEQHGLTIIGQPGEVLSYDPSRHEPVDTGSYPTGLAVRVRYPGIAYETTVIRKSAVEKLEIA